jgi:hypothetical protein
MANETLLLRGRIAVNEQTMQALSNGIDVDISTLRSKLDKFEAKHSLDDESIATVSTRLCDQIRQYRELHATTEKMRKELA